MSKSPHGVFEKLRSRMTDGSHRARARAYFRHRTRPNLLKMMKAVGLQEAEPLIARIASCTRAHPCRAVSCPVCGTKLKAAARDRMLRQIVERLGRMPQDTEVSFVTIDGPGVPMEEWELVRAEVGKFRKRLDNFRRLHLPGTGWTGFVDVSDMGVVHLHVVVVHPDLPRSRLETHLEAAFDGPNQVKVSRWKRSQPLVEALQAVVLYSLRADRHVSVDSLWDGPDLNRTSRDPARLVQRILLVQSLAGRGTEGLSFVRNMKPIVKGIIVPELAGLVRRTSRSRNSKSNPKLPWAPRGVLGTHMNVDLRKDEVRGRSDPLSMNTATDGDSSEEVKQVTMRHNEHDMVERLQDHDWRGRVETQPRLLSQVKSPSPSWYGRRAGTLIVEEDESDDLTGM